MKKTIGKFDIINATTINILNKENCLEYYIIFDKYIDCNNSFNIYNNINKIIEDEFLENKIGYDFTINLESIDDIEIRWTMISWFTFICYKYNNFLSKNKIYFNN